MALTITNTFSDGGTIEASEINANFTDVKEKFDAGITTDDINGSAGITNAQLANKHYEMLVNLEIKPTTAVAPGVSATVPAAVCALPGTATDGVDYEVVSGHACITNDGAASEVTTFNVQFGRFTGTPGAWVADDTPVASNSFTGLAGTNNLQSKDLTIASSGALTALDANPRFFALFLTAIGANALDTAYSSLVVTLKLKRASGLRS